jgi:glutamate-ammonia-ligase adenylyltransferase
LLLFNTSRHLGNWLCVDPESYDLIRMTEGRAVARELLVEELVSEVRSLDHPRTVMAALRRFKQRETLRIAYGDIVRQQPIARTTRQISYVADAMVEGALDFACRQVEAKRGRLHSPAASRPRFAVLALGKLGGLELNYSSDIDLVLLYEPAARSTSQAVTESQEYANRIAQELIRLLTEKTDMGFAYRVDMRLRPEGRHGPLCSSIEGALAYYDVRGRTWERQAYVKAGSLASTYTPLTEIAKLAANYIEQYRRDGQFPPPAYPDVFRIELNDQVARSLNIPLPDRQEIINSISERLAGSEEASDE